MEGRGWKLDRRTIREFAARSVHKEISRKEKCRLAIDRGPLKSGILRSPNDPSFVFTLDSCFPLVETTFHAGNMYSDQAFERSLEEKLFLRMQRGYQFIGNFFREYIIGRLRNIDKINGRNISSILQNVGNFVIYEKYVFS